MKPYIILLILILTTKLAVAQSTPVGLWKTVDDKTGFEKSYVRINELNGILVGRVEKLLSVPVGQNPVCEKCSDERKAQPILGMIILRNSRADTAREMWEGGDILDPNNGKIYGLRLKPLDGGKRLEVRGYIGPFFRDQQWIRIE